MLADIVFETMSIFREFVLSDKKATNSGLVTKTDLQESGSSELMSEVISSLEKVRFFDFFRTYTYATGRKLKSGSILSRRMQKGRRMKEQMRSESCCILKKMKKKPNEERGLMSREILAAQVDLRLIWRVLNLSRLNGDQLIWCKNKLSNINFVGRKVRREACFLLFPC